MGDNKAGDTDKDYATGYADGFAAGITAGFAATNKLQLGLSNPNAGVGADTSTDVRPVETKAVQPKRAETADTEINRIDVSHSDPAAVSDVDLLFLNTGSHVYKPPAHVGKYNDDEDNASTVTEEELGHLAPGCFVRVGSGDTSYWVEIGQVEGATISGMVHPELSGSLCVVDHDSCEIARFTREQITALGCDRYCWC